MENIKEILRILENFFWQLTGDFSGKLLTLSVSRPNGRNWITGQTPVRINVISEKTFVGKFISNVSNVFSEKDFCGKIHFKCFKCNLRKKTFEGKFISNLQYQSVVFLQDISGPISSQRRSDPFAKCGGHFWTNWPLKFMFAKISPSFTLPLMKFENPQKKYEKSQTNAARVVM